VGEERIVAVHIRAAEEYLDAARKLMDLGAYFAAVLCTATGMERAAMALILHLGGRPAVRHRHHEALVILQPLVREESRKAYREAVETIAELMGHLTMVRYMYEVAGEYRTPRELYKREAAQGLCDKAAKALAFIKGYAGF